MELKGWLHPNFIMLTLWQRSSSKRSANIINKYGHTETKLYWFPDALKQIFARIKKANRVRDIQHSKYDRWAIWRDAVTMELSTDGASCSSSLGLHVMVVRLRSYTNSKNMPQRLTASAIQCVITLYWIQPGYNRLICIGLAWCRAPGTKVCLAIGTMQLVSPCIWYS